MGFILLRRSPTSNLSPGDGILLLLVPLLVEGVAGLVQVAGMTIKQYRDLQQLAHSNVATVWVKTKDTKLLLSEYMFIGLKITS